MQLFYASEIDHHRVWLDESELRHVYKVLRHKVGDSIHVADGKGHYFHVRLTSDKAGEPTGEIVEILRAADPQANPIRVAIAPTKNTSRYEWFIEKATEVGVDEIYPIICNRSERKKINAHRCQKILMSAFKQSLRLWLPIHHPIMTFSEFAHLDIPGSKYIAHFVEGNAEIAHIYSETESTIIIGPEGDFTNNEYEMALGKGYKGINLGPTRLRTETAGLTAVVKFSMNRINKI